VTSRASENKLRSLIGGYWRTPAIAAATKLGLADHIAAGADRPESLAAATGMHAPSLYRLLRALATIDIFAEQPDGRFTLTPMAECLKSDHPSSLKALATMIGSEHYDCYGQLVEGLRTGEIVFDKIFGMPVFKYFSEHQEAARNFDAAMVGVHGQETAAMLKAYDFSPFGVLADVGGGNGSLISAVLKKYPKLQGMLVDLGHVIAHASDRLKAAKVLKRCQLIEGDFFQAVPAGADAYLMRHIIHDWDDERSILILKNIRKILPAHGRVLLVEGIVEPGNKPSMAKSLDLTMLLITGGMERTESQYEQLFQAAGLRLERIVPTASDISVIEAVPA
jgi:ubiquinone/menaquinone biosynthesis C-methylase UbiE